MSDEARELRLTRQIPAKDMVAEIQRFYPKFDKTMLSKCERGEMYGVVLKRDAMNALIERFAPDAKPAIKRKRDSRHRLTRRISARLEDEDYDALHRYIREDGYETMQEWLSDLVMDYIEVHRRQEEGAGL